MTTEYDRPPARINGKNNPDYKKWLHLNQPVNPGGLCECGCGKLLKYTEYRFKRWHQNERIWRLRSPHNVTYTFKNVNLFVKTHAHLFHSDDLIEKTTPSGVKYCSATRGLASISPRAKKPNGSWKGWRIDSQQERLFHEGKTLLEDITPRASSNTTRETPPQ